MDQVFAHTKRELEHFFLIYKELEGKVTATQGWGGPSEARRCIVEARERYLTKKSQDSEQPAV
jgi:inorganic pyrophosphatase